MASNIGDLTGRTLGTCILERLLGQGGMGAVYLARQTRPSRNVAVKVLLPNLAQNSQVYQEFLVRFRREADVIARLEHVNIMPIYEYGEQDGIAYLVMPLLTGGSLRDILNRRGALPLPEVATYIDQAAAALDYAHAQGVIHRDLKPANFLLAADGRLVLADFGIARIMEESNTSGSTLTSTGMLVGTPEYMAPEMIRGEPVDYRADIYELGVVLYQMISGHAPFTGSTPYMVIAKHVQETLPLLHQTNPAIPAAVDAVIQKATAKQREDRYSSAREMARDLRRAITDPRAFQQVGADNIPTVSAQGGPVVLPAPSPQYNTAAARPTAERQPVNRAWPNTAPDARNYGPPTYPSPQTPPYTPYLTEPRKRQPWAIVLGILFALVLIVGGVVLGLRLSRGTAGTPGSPGTTVVQTQQATSQTQATPTPAYTPTTAPSPTPTAVATTTPAVSSTVPEGTQIYAATSPGPNCDTNGGTWTNSNGTQITCQGNQTKISNTAQQASLQGIFLDRLPGRTYPANYVVQVQLQQDQNSSNDFGIYFRNQPGSQQGAYSFLIHANGSWNAYVYDNNTGAPTQLTGGNYSGDIHAPVTLAVVVSGKHFSFYADGKLLGDVYDSHYVRGTAGIAVDQGASVTASNFTLYTVSQ